MRRTLNLRNGLKLHFGNSAVDYHSAQHIQQLRQVFRAANGLVDQALSVFVEAIERADRSGIPHECEQHGAVSPVRAPFNEKP